MNDRITLLATTLALPLLLPTTTWAAPPAFSDQTSSTQVTTVHDTDNFDEDQYSGGGGVGDFNRDGFQDLYVISGGDGNEGDRLFINNGDGTFTNRAQEWHINSAHRGVGVAVGDFNDDGWPDIYVTSAGPMTGSPAAGKHRLLRNNGNGTFSNIAGTAGVNFTHPSQHDGWGACWGDYDRDGDLDLMVGGIRNNNAGSKLFRNDGQESFTDVTEELGIFSDVPGIFGFSPALVDMDGDWYPEILFVGDFGTSRYFTNNSGASFTESSGASSCADEENGMGQCRGDFDNDGRLDWYVTSIYFPSIGWTGNKLYRNAGPHQYVDYSDDAGVDDGGYGWGTVAVDFDHDGWLDIVETNGDSSTSGSFANEQSYLYMNNGNDTFDEEALTAGLDHTGKGRGLVRFDYDNDGDQDVVIFANREPITLFRNDLDQGGGDAHWLRIFLDTAGDETKPPMGYGARVYVTAGGQTMMRAMDGGDTFLGAHEFSAHFGLGTATAASEVVVAWPDGTETTLTNVAADQTITITSLNCPGDVNGDDEVGFGDLLVLLASWGPCDGDCPADLDGDDEVAFGDLLVLLASWGSCE